MLFYLGENQDIYTLATTTTTTTINIILECFASPEKYEVIMRAELSREGEESQARTEYTVLAQNIIVNKQILFAEIVQITLWNIKRFHFIKE